MTSLLAAMLFFAGCSRQATVELKDGSTVRGFIRGNRDGVLLVDVVEKDEEGTAVAVSGDSIKQITHPGTTATAVGVAALVVGGMLIAVSAVNECPEYPLGQGAPGRERNDWQRTRPRTVPTQKRGLSLTARF